ncbi:hypothetical protein MNBD_ALPHA09-354 [hydrothermal vent metagenome]|uniref:Oxidoreductase probably involved in sulfite reduction n=1 Tax=hydrothermal vent metagenome TaxID=652676 RepID=A0A3B0TW92_9ZZZZ
MPLIKNGALEPHNWVFAARGDPLPSHGDVVVDLMAFIETGEVAFSGAGRIGVALPNDADLGLIAARLGRIGLVTIDFPGFADGRGFSLARELRHSYRYKGELWARGYLIPDQYVFARACGFDGVLVDEAVFARQGEDDWREAAASMNLRYQLSHGDYEGAPQSILALRKAARQASASANRRGEVK